MKIKSKLFTLSLAVFGAFAFLANPVSAVDICTQPGVPDDVLAAAGCSTATTAPNDLKTTIENILEAIIVSLGILSVVFIIISGIGYITSSGDAGKLKKAKDTILYACIGLAVCVLAFAIVNWTIGVIGTSSTPTPTGP
ncbi:MAG: pilin [Candidatus Saccharibacteria bacterium]|nr:pilin [Candidatus Saccharibacteria bacterium]